MDPTTGKYGSPMLADGSSMAGFSAIFNEYEFTTQYGYFSATYPASADFWTTIMGSADAECFLTLHTVAGSSDICVRITEDHGNYYYLRVNPGGYDIRKVKGGGGGSSLKTGVVPLASGDSVELAVIGNTLEAYKWNLTTNVWDLFDSVTDSNDPITAAGYLAMRQSVGGACHNFGGGGIGSAQSPPGYWGVKAA